MAATKSGNRSWENEEIFVTKMVEQWGYKLISNMEKDSKPRSTDASYRYFLCTSAIPYSVLGSCGTGTDPVAARGSAIKNFMQRLKTSYIPNEVYSTVRAKGFNGNTYTTDVIAILEKLRIFLLDPSWDILRCNPESPFIVSTPQKALAKTALSSIRPVIHQFWGEKGMSVGPLAPNAPNTLKRSSEVANTTVTEPPVKKSKEESPVAIASASSNIIIIDDEQDDVVDDDDDIIYIDRSRTGASSSSDSDKSFGGPGDKIVTDFSINYTHGDENQSTDNNISHLPQESPQIISNDGKQNKDYSTIDYRVLLGVSIHNPHMPKNKEIRNQRNKHPVQFETFDEKIWRHYRVNKQNEKIYEWKMRVRQILQEEVQKLFPHQRVHIFAVGSTVNGCGSYNSDMDLCLCLPKPGTHDQYVEDRNFALRILRQVIRVFRYKQNVKQHVRNAELISAKVPIIKMEMDGLFADLEIDMNVNNTPGIFNSHLLHYYSSIDPRFPALCLLLKHWAIVSGVNDAMTGTFNSYSLILLMTHYLQCAVQPPVLPNLQYLYPKKFGSHARLDELNLFNELNPPLPAIRECNNQTVGELLVGFFQYYADFPFDKEGISIRQGKRIPRNKLPAENHKFKIFIEEPFDGKNTARCVTKPEMFLKIKNAFIKTSVVLSSKPPDLGNIGVLVPDI